MKDLSQFLQDQIDEKTIKITDNNLENIDLRMNIQHLKSAIKIINDAVEKEKEQ